MSDSIGGKIAQDLQLRATAESMLQEEASRKTSEQKASDGAALASLVERVRQEVENFNRDAEGLPHLTFLDTDSDGHYTLKSLREITFSIQQSKLQITVAPSHSPVLSNVMKDARGYVYRHIGPNGTATNRESTEDEMVDGLLRQACGF